MQCPDSDDRGYHMCSLCSLNVESVGMFECWYVGDFSGHMPMYVFPPKKWNVEVQTSGLYLWAFRCVFRFRISMHTTFNYRIDRMQGVDASPFHKL